MKIIFESEEDKTKFHNWWYECQGYVQQIEMCVHNSTILDEHKRNDKLSKNTRQLWYRIYDIDESLYEIKSVDLDGEKV